MLDSDLLIQIVPTDGEARVFIDCNRKADKPINRNLLENLQSISVATSTMGCGRRS